MSVGWSGNAVIKRGARGKSKEKLWTRSFSPTLHPQLPRPPSGTGAPAGARGRGEEPQQPAPAADTCPGPARLCTAPAAERGIGAGAGEPCRAGKGREERRGAGTQRRGQLSCPSRRRHGCDPVPKPGGEWDAAAGAEGLLCCAWGGPVSTLSRPGSP